MNDRSSKFERAAALLRRLIKASEAAVEALKTERCSGAKCKVCALHDVTAEVKEALRALR